MWGAIITLGLTVLTYVYHRYFESRPYTEAIGGRSPRIDEGAPMPLLYGRCRVRAPILVWHGGQRSAQITDVMIAYWLDMLYALGVPFYGGTAALYRIFADDTVLKSYSVTEWLTLKVTGAHYVTDQHGSQSPLDWTTTLVTDPPTVPNPDVPTLPVWGLPSPHRHNYVSTTPGEVLGTTAQTINGKLNTQYGFVEFFDGSVDQQISAMDDSPGHVVLTDTQGALEVTPMDAMFQLDHESDHVDPPRQNDFGVTYRTFQESYRAAVKSPSEIPSYRGLVMCCLYHWCHGSSPTMARYSFDVMTLSTGSASDLGQTLPWDADPAAVIYDLLTSPWGKLGLPVAKIDRPSFVAASITLVAEGHGYSNAFEDIADASDLIGDILKQIDGVLYEEPTTGLLTLKLIRNDYDVTTLMDANPNNTTLTSYSVQGWNETINQVRLTFTNRENNFEDLLVIGQNSANAFSQGRLRSADIRYPGCSTLALAQRLCSRELNVVSKPVVKATLTTDRSFYQKRPGDVITQSFPELGIVKMPMRIARVDLGQLHNNEIVLDVLRDAFGVMEGAYPVTFLPTPSE